MTSRLASILAAAWLLTTTAAALAQTGTVTGKITDADTGDELIAVDVVLIGTGRATQTDLDGVYTFEDVAVGKYHLRIAYLGYNTQVLTDIQVTADKAASVPVKLSSFGAYATDDVVVSASRILTTESAILADRKQAAVVGDAISAAQISRSPDATSGDALKRVTGLTVVEGQYVFVRGVTDRYNTTELNGVPVTSANTDRDRKSFAFDLVPANLLANTVVIKTATPDMPGDFSGGLVRVNTLEFPDHATTNVGVSVGRTEGVTGDELLQMAGRGHTDWLAIDDGTRDYPRGEPHVTRDERLALARSLPNNWGTRSRNAPSRYSFNISHGNRFNVLGDELGVLAALTYRNNYASGPYAETRTYPTDERGAGRRSKTSVLWGGLFNLNWRFDENHRMGLKNNYSRSGSDEVVQAKGRDSSKNWIHESTKWQERDLELTQLTGTDRFPRWHGLELKWSLYYNENSAKEPDLKFIEYNADDPEIPIMNDNLRSWSWLEEFRRGVDVDVTVPFGDEDVRSNIKVGTSLSSRRRSFDLEAWAATPLDYAWSPAWLPPAEIFPDSLWGADRGWGFIPVTAFSGTYTGTHFINAYYAMLDLPFSVHQEEFRIAGGVRVEDSSQAVDAVVAQDVGTVVTSKIETKDTLPSVNFTYLYDEHVNLRLGYYRSVNRPEFREMSAVRYYDFNRFQNVIGNPDLKRARIENWDVRLEYFPQYGEVLAVSYFTKDLRDAVEERLRPSPERNVLTWFNSDKGRNDGFELEARKQFRFWDGEFGDITVAGNYTRVWSEVEYQAARSDTLDGGTIVPVPYTDTRPLQGQSPWSINLSFTWEQPALGTSIAILYNKIGRRLATVGDTRDTDVYDQPRDLVDVALTQRIGAALKLKLAVKDIQGHDHITTSGPERNEYSREGQGTAYSASLSAAF